MRDYPAFTSPVECKLPGGVIVCVDGTCWFRERGTRYRASIRRLSASQVEVTAHRPSVWYEGTTDDLTNDQRAYLRALRLGLLPEPTDEQRAEAEAKRRALSLSVAANRAKSNIRRLCKTFNADALLTLTYRANQDDLALCKRHLKEFVRRLRRVCPGFAAVAGFERQKRGAWHVHLACPARLMAMGHGVKSFNVIRAIWRSVTGDLGGNIDVSKRFRAHRSSCARIAAYISKYITKAFAEGEKWTNRWTRFGEMSIPDAVKLETDSLRDLIVDAYRAVGMSGEVAGAWIGPEGDWFFFAGEGRLVDVDWLVGAHVG
ncbi:hypothetical protein ABIC63_000232 [Pseudacidovorax sp. 1753]|uniref:rolling circle replication-associated protein n=1 Tax=Pseudacidovorax sp. 1753 TaxID=3156419 RepID=UPI003399A60D